jgi:hypothetical protein
MKNYNNKSLSSSSKIKSKLSSSGEDDYWYVAYIILTIILIVLIGVLIYYLFYKLHKKTESSPSITPLPSITPVPSKESSELTTEQKNAAINRVLRKQVKEWGDDFNSFNDDKKNKYRDCYKYPENCAF